MRLLLVEDTIRLGELLSEGLARDGFVVDWRQNIEGAA